MKNLYLNKTQFNAELEKCLKCPAKPCMKACPVHCSPHDFIAAAQNNQMEKAAESIARQNVLGEVCGLICPDHFCMKACLRSYVDYPIRIPAVQAYIMKQARENKWIAYPVDRTQKEKIAVVGSGPAGLGAVTEFVRQGYAVDVFEQDERIGGALNLIPYNRLPREILAYEWGLVQQNPLVTMHLKTKINSYEALLQDGFAGVIAAVGEQKERRLNIEGENLAVSYVQYLREPEKYAADARVAVIGGGAVAVDCAMSAKNAGVATVEMFVRRRLDHMRITQAERQMLLSGGVDITTMTRVAQIEKQNDKLVLYTIKTQFDEQGKLVDVEKTLVPRGGFDRVVLALGSTRGEEIYNSARIVFAGDVVQGGSTAVEAVASGKNAAQILLENLKN